MSCLFLAPDWDEGFSPLWTNLLCYFIICINILTKYISTVTASTQPQAKYKKLSFLLRSIVRNSTPKMIFAFHIGSLLKTGLGQSYKLWLPVLASEHSKNFMNQHTIFLTVNQQIKQFCTLQGDFSLTICLMIFQNNSVDFQIFPHNEDVHCSHFKSLISKKESQ